MSSSVTVQLFQIIEQMSSRDIALVIGPDPADLSCMESPSMFGCQLPTLDKMDDADWRPLPNID